jgi:hypothetical protein
VMLAVRRWRREGGAGSRPATSSGPPSQASEKRLEADLERYDL